MTNRIYDDDDVLQDEDIDNKADEEDDAQAGLLAELEALEELGRPPAPR